MSKFILCKLTGTADDDFVWIDPVTVSAVRWRAGNKTCLVRADGRDYLIEVDAVSMVIAINDSLGLH